MQKFQASGGRGLDPPDPPVRLIVGHLISNLCLPHCLHRDGLLVFETGQRASLRCARLRRWMAFALPSAPAFILHALGSSSSRIAARTGLLWPLIALPSGMLPVFLRLLAAGAGCRITLVCLAAGDQRLELLLRRGQPPGRPITHGLARPPVLCLQRNPVDLRACAHVRAKSGSGQRSSPACLPHAIAGMPSAPRVPVRRTLSTSQQADPVTPMPSGGVACGVAMRV